MSWEEHNAMSWETRGNGGRYYTRTHHVGGRRVREYCGTGARGEQAAAEDLRRRAERAARVAIRRQEHQRLAALAAQIRQWQRLVDDLARLGLYEAGYHRHRGSEWRRRKHER
jgi:hypothetical protein